MLIRASFLVACCYGLIDTSGSLVEKDDAGKKDVAWGTWWKQGDAEGAAPAGTPPVQKEAVPAGTTLLGELDGKAPPAPDELQAELELSAEQLESLLEDLPDLAQNAICKCFAEGAGASIETPHHFALMARQTLGLLTDTRLMTRYIDEMMPLIVTSGRVSVPHDAQGTVHQFHNLVKVKGRNRMLALEGAFYTRLMNSSIVKADRRPVIYEYLPIFPVDWSHGPDAVWGADLQKMIGETINRSHVTRGAFYLDVTPAGIFNTHMADPNLMADMTVITTTADPFQHGYRFHDAYEGYRHDPRHYFSPSRDVSLVPGVFDEETVKYANKNYEYSKRTLLVSYVGVTADESTDNKYAHMLRHMFSALDEAEYEAIAIDKDPLSMDDKDYWDLMLTSKFCMVPRGHAVGNHRLVESILFGCIPVIIADHYTLPQGCFWDYSKFAVIIDEADAQHSVKALKTISPEKVADLQKNLHRVRKYFIFNLKNVPGDAFDMLMMEMFFRKHMCEDGRLEDSKVEDRDVERREAGDRFADAEMMHSKIKARQARGRAVVPSNSVRHSTVQVSNPDAVSNVFKVPGFS